MKIKEDEEKVEILGTYVQDLEDYSDNSTETNKKPKSNYHSLNCFLKIVKFLGKFGEN